MGNCGENNIGTLVDGVCVMPWEAIDRVNGLPPASTGARQVFHTESYSGTPEQKIAAAGAAATAVSGAVILDQLYTITSLVSFRNNVLYTGGGLKRASSVLGIVTVQANTGATYLQVDSVAGFRTGTACINTGVAYAQTIGTFTITSIDAVNNRLNGTFAAGIKFPIPVGARVFNEFAMFRTANIPASNVILENILFDGNISGNPHTCDWTKNPTGTFRSALGAVGAVRGCAFFDTPAENLFISKTTIEYNVAKNLGGSFTHTSATSPNSGPHVIRYNVIKNSNQIADNLMLHSEGCFTLSADSAGMEVYGNTVLDGGEYVYGKAQPEDLPLYSHDNYFARCLGRIYFYDGADPSQFVSTNDTWVDVPWNPPVITTIPQTITPGPPAASRRTIATVSDVKTQTATITVTAAPTTGVTITGIINVNGAIKAYVSVDSSSPVSVPLTATDITGLSSNANLLINGGS